MSTLAKVIGVCVILATLLLMAPHGVASPIGPEALVNCWDFAFSTEEDFVTQGPVPPDDNPIISDGDLLGPNCTICARNATLLQGFNVAFDLGLDAADVIALEPYLVAFSTELDSPNARQFTAGDLLVTNGVIILNQALTAKWAVAYDLGLDGVQFLGKPEEIVSFLVKAREFEQPIDPSELETLFERFAGVDIWFSTEGTPTIVGAPGFLDGDLLSARTGLVASNSALLPAAVPAGIPARGVDFGLDAVATNRAGNREQIHFSTEILFDGKLRFTDGDVLRMGTGVVASNKDLVACFEPKALMLGLDALSLNKPEQTECVNRISHVSFMPVEDIDPANGMIVPGAFDAAIPASIPFGGQIPIHGTICDDATRFRVVYRKAGSADPWEPMKVPPSKDWRLRTDGLWPPGFDCFGYQSWASDADGWFDALGYRDPTLNTCNASLPLAIWESTSAIGGADALYDIALEVDTPGGTIMDTVRKVQLDNKYPTVALEKTPGTCDTFTGSDMPLMITGRIEDAHFYRYYLSITGDSYGTHYYAPVNFWDNPGDNVIDTGTTAYPAYVNLHSVSVYDLTANPVKCGYTVSLSAIDRTLRSGFIYPANYYSGGIGTVWIGDNWSFQFTP